MLKTILTYFEMLIVPHALHCVDSSVFVFTSFDTVWHTVLVSVPAPPPPPPTLPQIFLSDLASLPLFPIFLSDLVLAPSSLHQPPPDKGHTVREYY